MGYLKNRKSKELNNTFLSVLLVVMSFLLCADCFSEDKTIIFAKGGLPYSTQTWFYSSELNETNIKKYWDESYRITAVAFTKNGWFVMMSKKTGITGQSYYYNKSFPTDWIKQKRNEGYYITAVSSSRSKWLVVMSKGTGYTAQMYKTGDFNSISSWYKEKNKLGYYVTAADYTGTSWWLVLSKGSDITSQGYFFAKNYSELTKSIKEKVWNRNYNVQLIEYGAEGFLVFYGKFKNNDISNRYCVDPSSPKENIQDMWNRNENVAYIGGGYVSLQTSNSSAATASGHALPYKGETKYWGRRGYLVHMSLKAYTDNHGEVIFEKFPSGMCAEAFCTEVYKKEYTDNGYYVLQKYKRRLEIVGLSQLGNERYEKLSGVIKVSFDGNSVIDEQNNSYDVVITKEEANQIDNKFNIWLNRMGGSGVSTSPSSGGSTSANDYGKCPDCNGSGVCKSCGGSGYKYNAYGGGYTQCPNCRGNKRCPICYGKGSVNVY